jgi:predicted amidophosphoribosyltransferase
VDWFVRQMARRGGLPVWPLLVRRKSASQKSLGREHRLANARGSYGLIPGARRRLSGVDLVWLVDDVVTTGATVEACSQLLRQAGAGEVRVFCLGLH